MLPYHITPLTEIHHPLTKGAKLRLVIKREDLNHPLISGNKWWKLKYNLEEAKRLDYKTILTFGGAYSNHIYAVAAAAKEYGFQSIGVIRGEETFPINATLSFAKAHGMQLHHVSREDYRAKTTNEFSDQLEKRFGKFYAIPEGGSNALAVKGCAEFAQTQLRQITFDYLFLPVGTGGTIAGITCGLPENKQVIGVSVLKSGEFLVKDIECLINTSHFDSIATWKLLTEYHHGGYAKTTPALQAFMKEMAEVYDIPLDHVYTAKMLWAVFEEVKRGAFAEGKTILAVHTGGLQGLTLK